MGGGRKGYEFEQAQLEKMRKILNKDLKIIERLQDAKKIDPVDEKKLAISQARVLKYADKLHASKTETELTGKDGGAIEVDVGVKKAIGKIYGDSPSDRKFGKDSL